MKKLLLISLIFILVFSFVITAIAKVNLTFWAYPYYTKDDKESGWYCRRVAGEFQEMYPEVNIEVEILPWAKGNEKVAIAIATDTTADILLWSAALASSYAQQGALCCLEDDVITVEDKADYLPGYVETFAVDGKMYQYFLNTSYGGGGMGANRILIEKAGAMDLLPLDRLDREWTVEEFKVFCQKVTKYIKENNLTDTYSTIIHLGDDLCQQVYVMWFYQCWGADPFKIVDGKYKCILNSPKAIGALQWYLDFYNDPTCGVMPGAENIMIDWWENYWLTGKVAIVQGTGSGAIIVERATPGVPEVLDTMIIPYPHGPGSSHVMEINTIGISAFKTGDTKKEKYSKLFCQFFATRPYMAEVTRMSCPPTYSSFDPDSPLYQEPLYDDCEECILDFERSTSENPPRIVDTGGKCPVYKQYRDIYCQVMQGVFTGELTSQEGLDIVVERVNKLLDEFYEENPIE